MIESPDGGVCNCVTYPCDCDGPTVYTEPPPIVDLPIVTPPVLPVDTPITAVPPTINATVATQTPTTQQAAADTGEAADGETPTILGFPWYYVAGAAAVLLLVSGGRKR